MALIDAQPGRQEVVTPGLLASQHEHDSAKPNTTAR